MDLLFGVFHPLRRIVHLFQLSHARDGKGLVVIDDDEDVRPIEGYRIVNEP